MSPRTAYAGLLEQLYLARAERTLTMTEEQEFACDLEELWYKLSDAEQGEVEDLTEEYKRDGAAGNREESARELSSERRST